MHLLKKRSARFYLGFLVVLALTVGGAAVGAFADSGTAQVAVNHGSLTMTGVGNVSATPVTLSGDDQTTTYSMGINVTDSTGSGSGWKLTITSTTFTAGSNTLDTGASTLNVPNAAV